ncbi:MAG TPA: hypothetical protein VKB35_15755 [Ktedonobacteraceae bacterium]|nr:hypothetical protein [Ktedonobacteraceae bacterium]
MSAIAMGKKLKELGLRAEDGNPTAQALCQGYCTPTPLKDGTLFSHLEQAAGRGVDAGTRVPTTRR